MKTIIHVDDHEITLKGIEYILNQSPNYQLIRSTSNPVGAYYLLQMLQPDIAILDIQMPEMNGMEIAQKLFDERLPIKVVLLSDCLDPALYEQFVMLGVKGFVAKQAAVRDIVECLDTISRGEIFISKFYQDRLASSNEKQQNPSLQNAVLQKLTSMEKQVLKLVSQGKTSNAISELLFISIHTVNTHRKNICEKLHLEGNHALIKFAIQYQHLLEQMS